MPGPLISAFEFLSFTTAKLVAAALIVAAGYMATMWIRQGRPDTVTTFVRVLGLAVTALFVWLRPGVTNLGGSMPWFLLPTVCALLAIGSAVTLVTPPRAGRGTVMATVVLACLMALSSAALQAARYWDMSGWMDSHSYDVFALNIATGKVPHGSSEYMPLYQYGMALVDLVFGHFFFVHQTINVLLAVTAIAALCLAAWVLFQSAAAVIMAGLWAAFTPQFYQSVHLTQIENWYVPIVCVLLLCWACYWRRRSGWTLGALAAAISLGVNTRNQGAPFLLLMAATPLCVGALPLRRRVVDAAVIGFVVILSLMPWTIRNYAVEGRFSPSASRTAYYLGMLNDRRVGFYGLRYWDGANEVAADYDARYRDAAEKRRALVRSVWINVGQDPEWLARAVFWRSLGFYGLLPPGVLEIDRVRETDWASEWKPFVLYRTTQLLLLPLSAVAVLRRPTRLRVFLAASILASVSIVVVAASPEDRISYPVLPLHILLVGSLWADEHRMRHGTESRELVAGSQPLRIALAPAALLVIILTICHFAVGSRFLYRPLIERAVTMNPRLDVDRSRPLLNRWLEERAPSAAVDMLTVGETVRVRCMVSNYMLPPKSVGPVAGLPAFATDPRRETYYHAYLVSDAEPPTLVGTIPVTFVGAELSGEVREGDVAEIEGAVVWLDASSTHPIWLRAIRVKKMTVPRSQLPPFAS